MIETVYNMAGYDRNLEEVMHYIVQFLVVAGKLGQFAAAPP